MTTTDELDEKELVAALQRGEDSAFEQLVRLAGGRMLAVEEAPEVIEGSWDTTRTVLIEFDDAEQMKAWYHSEGYQALAQHRFAASTGDIALLAGFEGLDALTEDAGDAD